MKDFKGTLGNYKIVQTSDQSYTLWSEAFNENCHSLTGAKQETRYIYIEGCELSKKALKGEVKILEVGFGAGHGLKETYDFFLSEHPQCKVHFYSLEIEPALIPWAFEHTIKLPCPEKQGNVFSGKVNHFSYTIIVGDARKELPLFSLPPIDAFFQDAFSPDKNSSLWTVEWFDYLKKLAAPEAILTTYSASSKVKKALLYSGWSVSEREGFTGKRGSIRADLSGNTSEEFIKKLESSPVSPFHD